MNNLYKKIDCTYRLPNRSGYYNTNLGELIFIDFTKHFLNPNDEPKLGKMDKMSPSYWFEKISEKINPKPGMVIKTYGQIVEIKDVENFRCYLEHPIVVPTIEYTVDNILTDEIDEIL